MKTGLVENQPYAESMGRKPNKDRPPQGAHILKLRMAAGLTQGELADMLGETQSNIAFWEKSDKPPRSDVLQKMADSLGVTVEDLLRPQKAMPKQRGGPIGKLQLAFDEASKLPRAQQEKIVEILQTVIHGIHGSGG